MNAKRRVGRWLPGHVSVAMVFWLTLIWIAVFGSLSWLTLLSGVLVSVLVQLVFPMPSQKGLWHVRVFAFAYLLAHFIYDLVKAGLQVARVVLTSRDHDDGIVRCDVRSGNPVYMTIVAAMTSMIPGTIVVETEQREKALYLHCLDLEAQGGVEGIKQMTWAQEKRVLYAFAPNRVLEETGLAGPKNSLISRVSGRAK